MKNFYNKIQTFINYRIFIDMGRPKKEEKDKKIKVGICLDRFLYTELMKDGGKVSRIIEKIIREYYGNKNLS